MTTKSMSIYLLKYDVTVKDAIKDGRGYEKASVVTNAIPELRVFLKRGIRKQPWWKTYLGLDSDLSQQSNSAAASTPWET